MSKLKDFLNNLFNMDEPAGGGGPINAEAAYKPGELAKLDTEEYFAFQDPEKVAIPESKPGIVEPKSKPKKTTTKKKSNNKKNKKK
jgi:hypothetical protein